jgi:hypothetical protein
MARIGVGSAVNVPLSKETGGRVRSSRDGGFAAPLLPVIGVAWTSVQESTNQSGNWRMRSIQNLTSWVQRFLLFAILLTSLLDTHRVSAASTPDIQTLQRLARSEKKPDWRGAGVTLIGCDIVERDALRRFGAREIYRFGDQIDLVIYLKTSEPLISPTRILLTLGGQKREAFIEALADSQQHGPGAVLQWAVTILIEPIPTMDEPLPFFRSATYSLGLTVSQVSGGLTLLNTEIANLGISPFLGSLTGVTRCLSANVDIPDDRKSPSVLRLDFPDGIPTAHSSSLGGLKKELFDGVLTGSGNPYWESMFWHVGWGQGKGSIELTLERAMVIDAVALVVVNPYSNYSAREITVTAKDEENAFVEIGTASVVEDSRRPAIRTIFVETRPTTTRTVKVELHQSSGEYIALSEAYLFGRPGNNLNEQ